MEESQAAPARAGHSSPFTFAPRSGLILSVPPGKTLQNSLRIRLAIVALLFMPWYRATTSSIATSRAFAEKVLIFELLTLVFGTAEIII